MYDIYSKSNQKKTNLCINCSQKDITKTESGISFEHTNKSSKVPVSFIHRIRILQDQIEEKELEWARVYEECLKGQKQYKQEFLTTIRDYNQELLDYFDETKRYPKPSMNLIQNILEALNGNYKKFQNFHNSEVMFKNSVIERLTESLKVTEEKLEAEIRAKKQNLSSYE